MKPVEENQREAIGRLRVGFLKLEVIKEFRLISSY